MAAAFTSSSMSLDQAEELYRGDDLAARLCDLLPADMTRQWLDVLVKGDKETTEEIGESLKTLRAKSKFREALTWARVFGGAAMLPVAADESGAAVAIDGSDDLSKPLDETKIQSIAGLNVFDAREVIAVAWYGDPLSPRYGEPVIYRLQPLTLNVTSIEEQSLREQEKKGNYSGLQRTATASMPDNTPSVVTIRYIHESRILRFDGVRLTRRLERVQWGWGDSIYVRLLDEIRDFQGSFDSTAVLLHDFAQGVFKMDGLAEAIASGNQALVMARMQAIDLARSVVKAAVIDTKGEEFKREVTPVAGLADLLDKFMTRISAAGGYPVTLLFGVSPAGLNATGASDIRLYYDKVKDQQEERIGPPLTRLLELLFLAKDGPTDGQELEDWSIQYRPLWQLDEVQQADVRLKTAQGDALYLDRQVVTPEEIAVSRWGGDAYSIETQLEETDPEKRAVAASEASQAEAEAQAAIAAAAKPVKDKTATDNPKKP
jgi:phage-related protein (TIGR01555 family)